MNGSGRSSPGPGVSRTSASRRSRRGTTHERADKGHPAALAAALCAALLVSGCKSLTADGGMAFVEDVANNELRKDVVAIRNPEQAEEVHARVAALLRKPLTADSRGADRAAEQSRPAGRL